MHGTGSDIAATPYSHVKTALEDTVEFFNLVLGLQLSADEKQDLAAFLKVL
jgi:hypothetical protein